MSNRLTFITSNKTFLMKKTDQEYQEEIKEIDPKYTAKTTTKPTSTPYSQEIMNAATERIDMFQMINFKVRLTV